MIKKISEKELSRISVIIYSVVIACQKEKDVDKIKKYIRDATFNIVIK